MSTTHRTASQSHRRSTSRLLATGAVIALGLSVVGGCAAWQPTATAASSGITAQDPGTAPPAATTATTATTADDPATIELVGSLASLDRAGGAPVRVAARLRHVLHATWVTDGHFPTTHAAIRGKVTSVSPSQITITARDGVSMTFGITDDTVIRHRGDGRGEPGSADEITVNDRALVSGLDTGSRTARFIVYVTPGSAPAPAGESSGPDATPPGS